MEDFIKEREEAFSSMNEKKIRAYCEKYKIQLPEDDNIFWAGVHKVICELFSHKDTLITEEQYKNSYDWLKQNGFTTNI